MSRKIRNDNEGIDFEIAFLKAVVKNSPNFIDALVILGDHYTKRGFYKEGLEVDVKLSRLLPQDPSVWYNLACSYSLLKMSDQALNTLDKAIELGFCDIKLMATDPDLQNIWDNPAYNILLSKLERKISRRRKTKRR